MYVVRWLRAVQVPSMGHISDLSLEFSAPEALLSLRRSERPTALLLLAEEEAEGVGPWFSLPARSPTECSSGGLPGWARGWLSVCFFGSLPLQGWSRREAVYITYMPARTCTWPDPHLHAHGHGCGRTHTHLRLVRRALRSPTRPADPPRRQHERFERPQRLERVDFGGSSRSRCAT